MLWANGPRSAEPRKLSGSPRSIWRTVTMLGCARTALSGTRCATQWWPPRSSKTQASSGSAMPKLPAAPEVNPVCAIWPSRVMRLLRRRALLQDGVPDLAAVALLHERVGGEDRRVERRGGAVVDAQLVDIDAALGHAAPGEQPDVLVVGGVTGDDLQVDVVVGRPVVVVAHEDRAVGRGVLAGEDEVAPVRAGRGRAGLRRGRGPGAAQAGRRHDDGEQQEEQDCSDDGSCA